MHILVIVGRDGHEAKVYGRAVNLMWLMTVLRREARRKGSIVFRLELWNDDPREMLEVFEMTR